MRLLLERDPYRADGTTGKLSIDGAPFCVTLERAKDDPEHPCIPAGIYPVRVLWSPKFARNMPHVLRVPERTAIEIHWGNFVKDTLGCVLVGATKTDYPAPTIWSSRDTFDRLFPLIERGAADAGGVTIEIREPAAAAIPPPPVAASSLR